MSKLSKLKERMLENPEAAREYNKIRREELFLPWLLSTVILPIVYGGIGLLLLWLLVK